MEDDLDILPDVSFADNFNSDLSASGKKNYPDSPRVKDKIKIKSYFKSF